MVKCKADLVLKRIEELAKRKCLPIIGPEKGEIIAKLVRKFKPKRILEVGTLIGYSTIIIGKELDEDAEIITIEIDEDEAEIARRNIIEAELKPRVTVIVGDALEVIPRLNGSFDMVFLDANKREYYQYLKLVEDKLHKGSIIIADNAGIYSHSMRRYLEYVRKSGKYKSRFIPVGWDGIEVSIKL